MRISELPQFSWLAGRNDVKVVRHRDSRLDLLSLYQNGKFEWYQNGQGRPVFARAQYLISFIAERDKYARFVGVWKILGVKKNESNHYRYRSQKIDGFESLENRLIVSWGAGTRSWVQLFHRAGDKAISELLPENYVREFPGFYDFTLSYPQLQKIAQHPDANREWVRMLRAVAGIYAILDTATGKLYIGSAYGLNGIWQRWKAYAKNPTGGNDQLKKRLEEEPGAEQFFQFSLLRVMEPNAQKREVIEQENLLKAKLGSRVHGLNSN